MMKTTNITGTNMFKNTILFTNDQMDYIISKIIEAVPGLEDYDSKIAEVVDNSIKEYSNLEKDNKEKEIALCAEKIKEKIDMVEFKTITSDIVKHYNEHTIIDLEDSTVLKYFEVIYKTLLDLYYITYKIEFLHAHEQFKTLMIGNAPKTGLILFIDYCRYNSDIFDSTLFDK